MAKKLEAMQALDKLAFTWRHKSDEGLLADYETVKAALEEGYNYYATQKQVNELCEYVNELKAEITRLK